MNFQKRARTPWWLNVVALLSLVMVLLPGPALAQPALQELVDEVLPAPQVEEAVEPPIEAAPEEPAQGPVGVQPAEAAPEAPAPVLLGPEAPADYPPGPWAACSNPSRPAGAWKFSIGRDDEYGVLWRRGDGAYQLWSLLDRNRTSLAVSTIKDHGGTQIYNEWMHGTAVDFDGDSDDEMFMAYKNGSGQLAAESVINPSAATPTIDYWNSNSAVGGYIDVAAGNLRGTTDGKKSVVIAYQNAAGGLQMAILDGDATGGIAQANGSWINFVNTDQGRGTVWYVAVATGDLDGDGIDNEIVTAFKDANYHLQILVTRLALVNNAWTWQKIDEFRFDNADTAHYADTPCVEGDYGKGPDFGVDVTTGDVDGDAVEEAIVAFPDKGNWLQTLAMRLVRNGTADELAEAGYYRGWVDTKTPRFVAVAAPDLNSDGIAEITTAWSPQWKCDGCCVCYGEDAARFWRMHWIPTSPTGGQGAIAYDYQYTDNHDGYNVPEYLKIEAADVDRDLQQEVVFSWIGVKKHAVPDPNDWIPVSLIKEYHGEPLPAGMTTPADGAAYLVNKTWYDSHNTNGNDVSVIVGDFNSDSVLLTYTGECYQYGDTTINTVVSLPPFWYDYNADGVDAQYGVSTGGGYESGTTGTVTLGASAKIDLSSDILGFEAGPTFEASVEASHSISKAESQEMGTAEGNSTSLGPSGSAFGFVVHDAVDYKVYKYIESENNAATWLRAPSVSGHWADITEKWNTLWSYNGWLPMGSGPRINLAENLAAARYTQSSTFESAAASRAGDGNVDGVYTNGSVSHTNSQAGAWWQVDLTGSATEQLIESVSIWNRNDMMTDRLKDYVVKVYDADHNLKWTSATQTVRAGRPTNVWVGRSGRYVQVALTGTNYLVMAEVQVWKENRVNLALGRPTTSYRQSSTYTAWGIVGEAWRAGDGNTDGNFANGSVTHTSNSPANSWWQVDLGSRQFIGSVDIWNRTDSYPDRLKNYTVKVYDTTTDPSCGAVNAGDTDRWESPVFTGQAGTPTWVRVQKIGRFVCIQLKGTDSAQNYLTVAEVQVWKARQVPDFPKGVSKITGDDTRFVVTNQDNTTQKATGQLQWDWCQGYLGTSNIPVAGRDEKAVYRGATSEDWNMYTATGRSTSWESTFGATISMGFEAKAAGVGVEASFSAGFERGFSRTISWNGETYYAGSVEALADEPNDNSADYKYCPYLYLMTATGNNDVPQQYLVLDYYVPCYGAACNFSGMAAAAPAAQPEGPPATPLIDSPTHPDPNAWSSENTVTFTWLQPDPTTGLVYRWYLDKAPDTVPDGPAQGARQTETYYGLADGTWYLHVRAMNTNGEWSETAHRQIRIDRRPPEVTLALDPPVPAGNQGWYTTPVTVTATVVETGSGVATVETSTDEGATWQPYTGPLHYTTDTPPTTIWARATDGVVHVSEPVSTSLKVDLIAPDSHTVGPGCVWGVCFADIVVDAQGNEHLVLMGQIHEDTSGASGMEIQANGGRWTGAGAVGTWYPDPARPEVAVNWVYTATLDIGHGYHIFKGRAVDGAGHAEEPYEIAQFIWYPLSSPDLGGSTIAIEPAVVRPGDTVEVLMAVRNGGRQEAQVDFTATLPAGLTPVEDTYRTVDSISVIFDAAANALSWPAALLWPGETRYARIRALVGEDAAGTLTARLDAHAYWPNTDLLPADWSLEFQNRESVITTSANLTVDPGLPAQRDVAAPQVRLEILELGGERAGDTVELAMSADADAGPGLRRLDRRPKQRLDRLCAGADLGPLERGRRALCGRLGGGWRLEHVTPERGQP